MILPIAEKMTLFGGVFPILQAYYMMVLTITSLSGCGKYLLSVSRELGRCRSFLKHGN